MKINNLFITIALATIGCKEATKQQIEPRAKEKEIIDVQFADDNIIFPVGRKYTFDYTYIKDNVEYFAVYKEGSSDWDLIPVESAKENPNAITYLTLKVPAKNFIRTMMPDYTQTSIAFSYEPVGRTSQTGVKEDETELWMHPPRQDIFKILEFNPYPTMKLPVSIGQTWTQTLSAGTKYWGDDRRWKKWEGTAKFVSSFEVTGSQLVDTPIGELMCYVVEAKTVGVLGTGTLKAYFNEKYGFVVMDYVNVDGSTLQLKVIKVTN